MTQVPTAAPLRSERVASLDLLRGLVMVLMALDHTRDFFGDPRVSPEAVGMQQPLLFLTRWVTHICAPSFVFLAGVSAFLHGTREYMDRARQTRFLVVRGLWLLLLEVSVVSAGWLGALAFNFTILQVIGAIGIAMVALGGLIWLPRKAILAISLILVAGHNLMDDVISGDLGSASWLWTLVHEGSSRAPLVLFGHQLWIQYAVLPWVGIMGLGYACGPILQGPRESRRKQLFLLGTGVITLFVFLRYSGIYGDPDSWETQQSVLATCIDFVNVTKYPPSLLFSLMTLGPALVFLACFDREPSRPTGWLANKLVVFGRVPLFYYILHLFVIQISSGLLAWVRDGHYFTTFERLFGSFLAGGQPLPASFGNDNDLLTVYGAWLIIVVGLYPVCRWYGERKRAGTSWLWSYL